MRKSASRSTSASADALKMARYCSSLARSARSALLALGDVARRSPAHAARRGGWIGTSRNSTSKRRAVLAQRLASRATPSSPASARCMQAAARRRSRSAASGQSAVDAQHLLARECRTSPRRPRLTSTMRKSPSHSTSASAEALKIARYCASLSRSGMLGLLALGDVARDLQRVRLAAMHERHGAQLGHDARCRPCAARRSRRGSPRPRARAAPSPGAAGRPPPGRAVLEGPADHVLAREAEDALVRRVDVDALERLSHSINASAEASKMARYCASPARSSLRRPCVR